MTFGLVLQPLLDPVIDAIGNVWAFIAQFGRLVDRLPGFFTEVLDNLSVFAVLIPLGFAVGIVIALIQVYTSVRRRARASPMGQAFELIRVGVARGPWAVALAWEWFFRGVPALVLLFLFYYGSPQLGINISPFMAAALAMGFRSSGYQSQIFRGAIQSISSGQIRAAQSIGMGRLQTIGSIVLPQALRLAIPAWSNEFSSELKDTTLIYAIGINEVLRFARNVSVNDPTLTMHAYITVALLFWALTSLGNTGLQLLERRLALPGFEARGTGSAESRREANVA